MSWVRGRYQEFFRRKYLAKELVRDQYVNLEQAGHAPEERIPLGRVFVDLPTDGAQVKHEVEDHAEDAKFVRRLVDLASAKLDQQSIAESKTGRTGREEIPLTQRLVLVGGPGQGKSTLGQFVCQIFRAAILDERRSLVSAEVNQALDTLLRHCGDSDLPIPSVRRFPLRITLNEFAAALASSEGHHSVLDYVGRRISDRVGVDLPRPVFRQWLRDYPWLLVFDGLDEVPATSNRSDVLNAITDFWTDVAEGMSDVLVLATTRPQKYNDEFSPSLYRHEHLVALTETQALEYGRRLAAVRYHGDDEKQQRVISRLERAAGSDATARLMKTPLQVTIMTALVERMGQPPQERWSLFQA